MAIVVTDIGNASAFTTNVSIAVPVGGVPAGALIYVGGGAGSVLPSASGVTDGSNTYTKITSGGSGSTFIASYFSANATALTSGTNITITVTATSTATIKRITAFYATGIATSPLDSGVTATASGTSTAVSVTSGAASVSGDLFVGLTVTAAAPVVFTQATGWTSPPDINQSGTAPGAVAGGNQVNAGSGALTYNPQWSVQGAWFANVAGFKALATSVKLLRMVMGVGV